MKVNLAICLLVSWLSFCQEFTSISRGKLETITGQTYDFISLKRSEMEIEFINKFNNAKVYYFINSIKNIIDSEGNVVYQNLKFIKTPEQIAQEKLEKLNNEKTVDSLFSSNYPEGIYKSIDDFIMKKPSEITEIDPRGLIGLEKPYLNTIEHNCFFYYTREDSKVKNAFAISYKGNLYFQIRAILSNRNKTDRAQTNDFPNSFVRVILGGKNYLYTELNLANKWEQGLAYGAIGGAVGSSIARTMIYGKGVVWDFKNNEFNIFKNCEDFNTFITKINPKYIQNCENKQPDMTAVRNIIEKIK